MSLKYNEKAYFEMCHRYENKIRVLKRQLEELQQRSNEDGRNIRGLPSASRDSLLHRMEILEEEKL